MSASPPRQPPAPGTEEPENAESADSANGFFDHLRLGLSRSESARAERRDGARGARIYDLLFLLLRLGPGLILILLFVAMTFASPYFLTERNLQNLGNQSAIVAALALGQLLVIITRGIDVSVGSVLALSGIVGISFGTLGIASGASVIAVILLTGAVAGALNALFIVKGRLPQPLIVTLATLGIARGIALLITNGEIKTTIPPAVTTAGSGFVGPVPLPVILVGAVAAVLYVLATRTRWGRWVYATGGNPDAARDLGLPVDRIQMSVYVLSGLAAGFAAIIWVGRTGSASPFAGQGLELDAITAVIIGGASLFGGRGSIGGVLVGALILGTIRNGLDLLSVSPYWQTIALGSIVLLALELDMVRGRLEERVRTAHAGGGR